MSVSKPPSNPAPLVLVKGDATEEEVAALVAVLASAAATTPAAPRRPVSQWGAPHRKVRVTYERGPGGWRASALPR